MHSYATILEYDFVYFVTFVDDYKAKSTGKVRKAWRFSIGFPLKFWAEKNECPVPTGR